MSRLKEIHALLLEIKAKESQVSQLVRTELMLPLYYPVSMLHSMLRATYSSRVVLCETVVTSLLSLIIRFRDSPRWLLSKPWFSYHCTCLPAYCAFSITYSQGLGGSNAKDIISKQAEVRESIRQAGDEWNEMDAIYKKEARKKKSKFTLEELEVQSELVKRLHAEIEKIKEAQMRGYAKNRDAGTAVGLNTKALYADAGTYYSATG